MYELDDSFQEMSAATEDAFIKRSKYSDTNVALPLPSLKLFVSHVLSSRHQNPLRWKLPYWCHQHK